ncbi:hypothetical protein A2955_02790 [Candidatus Woesebacteria bacterium RIFCSPLOWO2_01_FULL_37_19]|uniref:Uncharacterized protein n=2 Tax=Candidatus Woeseibacteriota TaxID=1752722 RepID=A0A1F8BAP4_9BACT|nr:MAG: hypothetical protein A2771_00195 [Candidatus Woesebacteria bacterium RIFCSPHIGHO2_01_FULL_38_26b]OGM61101.1 MAG: hypothetical protein A2955_02790 [Candidatus Woesebacteria bacterium RIFCSPLOWO2_01_FULL_37_19]
MPKAEAKIVWVDIKDLHHTGGLMLTLPENTNCFDFIHASRDNLPDIIGCEKCPMYKQFPAYAEEWIRPVIGNIHQQKGAEKPKVEIICEGTDKAARGRRICTELFRNEQTVYIELLDRT